jgi:gliding motility-associated lipoprotein GldJ
MVFIEGGRAVMGSFEEDVMSYRDNIERTVSVASFYMDETEIANIHWTEYLHYITIDSPRSSNPAVKDAYARALPDTLVWKGKLAFNDPYVEYYLRYPGFRFFPVVGINWKQANEYAKWRTQKVNDDLNKRYGNGGTPAGGTTLGITSGFQIPAYRLPTEAEWEYAAQALIGTQWLEELQTHQRIYPWDGHALRNPYGKQMGTFLANFKRGRGDYAGIAGRLNDGALITSYIYEYPPNDYGLYNMAGNVSEWVMDVYRPLSFQDFDDLNPIRRDEFLDDNNSYRNRYKKEKDSTKHDIYTPRDPESFLSLVSDKARVYKGGSWKDVAYWMSPGTRRFLDEDSATATIGFRCAMIRAGSNR